MSKALFQDCIQIFGEVCGKMFLCVLLGTPVGGADDSPDETAPRSFACKQLCPALARVYFSILLGVKF